MNSLTKFCAPDSKKNILLYLCGSAFFLAAIILGISLGSTALSLSDIRMALTEGAESGAGGRIFLYVRLPRTCACLISGAALAVSGAVIQRVLANRLASPSIIGVNSGAGLAVTLCTALGLYGGWQLSFFSFLGAFSAVVIVSLVAQRWGASRGTVILIGVALNSLLGALSDTVTTFYPDIRVMAGDFKVGDFSGISYQKLIPAGVITIISLVILFTLTNDLDVLSLGEENARGLGLNTSVMKTAFLILAALLAGCAVSIAGLLSFVGLIVPHIVRRLGAGQSKHLLPLCALYGASFVTVCDTVARTAFSPYEIPVGIIMSFFGAPFFVFLLIKRKGGHADA